MQAFTIKKTTKLWAFRSDDACERDKEVVIIMVKRSATALVSHNGCLYGFILTPYSLYYFAEKPLIKTCISFIFKNYTSPGNFFLQKKKISSAQQKDLKKWPVFFAHEFPSK